MPTTDREKPANKSRQRSRKADQRNMKGEKQALPEQVFASRAVAEPVIPAIEAEPIEAASAAVAAAQASEPALNPALNGELLPPATRRLAPQIAGPFAVAFAYGEYTRKSWLAGRFLLERLIAVRTVDQAIEVQGEFVRFACANFLAQSERIGAFYGAWGQQFFKPFETFAR